MVEAVSQGPVASGGGRAVGGSARPQRVQGFGDLTAPLGRSWSPGGVLADASGWAGAGRRVCPALWQRRWRSRLRAAAPGHVERRADRPRRAGALMSGARSGPAWARPGGLGPSPIAQAYARAHDGAEGD